MRDDRSYWQQIESYINTRTGTDFSHSICPDCYTRVVAPQLEALWRETVGATGVVGLTNFLVARSTAGDHVAIGSSLRFPLVITSGRSTAESRRWCSGV